jgi:hypothetical protein
VSLVRLSIGCSLVRALPEIGHVNTDDELSVDTTWRRLRWCGTRTDPPPESWPLAALSRRLPDELSVWHGLVWVQLLRAHRPVQRLAQEWRRAPIRMALEIGWPEIRLPFIISTPHS